MSDDKTSESIAICDTVVFYVHSKGFVRPACIMPGQSIHASRERCKQDVPDGPHPDPGPLHTRTTTHATT